jgi:hypothetical protein
MLVNPDASDHYYEAPVSLPNGATITKFVVWYYDNNATLDMSADLALVSVDATHGTSMANVTSSGASTGNRYGQITTISNATIDLQSYSYFVQVYLPPSANLGVLAFRIDYQYASYLSLITK